MKQAFIYSLKVWLTVILVGPLLFVILTKLLLPHANYFDSFGNILGSIGLLIYVGTVVSLPCWFLLWLSTILICKYDVINKKVYLASLSVVLCLSEFYLIFHNDDHPWKIDTFVWMLAYVLLVIITIWYYKLKSITT
jgi:Ca2+/Na+ antiporter